MKYILRNIGVFGQFWASKPIPDLPYTLINHFCAFPEKPGKRAFYRVRKESTHFIWHNHRGTVIPPLHRRAQGVLLPCGRFARKVVQEGYGYRGGVDIHVVDIWGILNQLFVGLVDECISDLLPSLSSALCQN